MANLLSPGKKLVIDEKRAAECRFRLIQKRADSFDVKAGQKRPAVYESLEANCIYDGVVIATSTSPCRQGIGWEVLDDASIKANLGLSNGKTYPMGFTIDAQQKAAYDAQVRSAQQLKVKRRKH